MWYCGHRVFLGWVDGFCSRWNMTCAWDLKHWILCSAPLLRTWLSVTTMGFWPALIDSTSPSRNYVGTGNGMCIFSTWEGVGVLTSFAGDVKLTNWIQPTIFWIYLMSQFGHQLSFRKCSFFPGSLGLHMWDPQDCFSQSIFFLVMIKFK